MTEHRASLKRRFGGSCKLTLTPYDTGRYIEKHGTAYGTLRHYRHLIKHHVDVERYNFGKILARWWKPGTPPPDLDDTTDGFWYFEAQWMGNAWLPEALLYIIGKFSTNGGGSKMWYTTLGSKLQNWLRDHGRPLIWADGDDSGMVIDAYVGNIYSVPISANDMTDFLSHWHSGASFPDLYKKTPTKLHLHLRAYDYRHLCEDAEKDNKNMIIGTNSDDQCVYWKWTSNPSRYECLNDGTCWKTDSERAYYSSHDDCSTNCGNSKWACVRSTGVDSEHQGAHHCLPDQSGNCLSRDECEKCCTKDGDHCGNALGLNRSVSGTNIASQPIVV